MPRFRIGRSVPINVYDNDDPVFQGHTPEKAAELVELLNRGDRFADAAALAYHEGAQSEELAKVTRERDSLARAWLLEAPSDDQLSLLGSA